MDGYGNIIIFDFLRLTDFFSIYLGF